MERIKLTFTVLHYVVWILLFTFFCWVFASEGHDNWLSIASAVFGASLAVFYSHFYILTKWLGAKKIASYLIGLILIFGIGPLLFIWLEAREISDWHSFADQYFTTLLTMVMFCVILSWMARATENWFINTLKRETLEKQTIRAELAYLKAQINPHFLFNTLNNIHSLAYTQSPATPDAIMQLSSLMRYMLYDSNANSVILKKEIDYLNDFISLQQLRFKEQSIVEMNIDGDPASCYVAPLLFVHLLENAYKHSPGNLERGDIKISIVIEASRINFTIINPVANQTSRGFEEPGGFGLENIKKRLELLYPNDYTFEYAPKGKIFKAELTIPVRVKADER